MDLTLAEALERGIAAHREGQLEDAERFYKAILSVQPNHSDANHDVGVLAVSVGKAVIREGQTVGSATDRTLLERWTNLAPVMY